MPSQPNLRCAVAPGGRPRASACHHRSLGRAGASTASSADPVTDSTGSPDIRSAQRGSANSVSIPVGEGFFPVAAYHKLDINPPSLAAIEFFSTREENEHGGDES